MLHYFRRRTTAVDVENVGPDFLRHLSRHAHAFRLAAKDLHRERPLVLVKTHLPFRFRIVSRQTFDGNKLRNRQAHTTTPLQQTPERHVRHARHRRKHKRRIDLDVANFERLHGLIVTGVPTETASYNSLMSSFSSATQPHVQSLFAP